MTSSRHGNLQKHLNPNPVQQKLLAQFHRRIARLVEQTGAARLLDAGCGEGFTIEYLQTGRPSLQIVAGDFSLSALRWGRENLHYTAAPVNFDLHHLPFQDNSFPLVICLEVLEHLPDSRAGLRELARVSSEYVLCSVPHEPWFRLANFLRGKHLTAFGNDPEHLHNYTGHSFRRMVGGIIDILWHGYSFPWQIVLGRKRNHP